MSLLFDVIAEHTFTTKTCLTQKQSKKINNEVIIKYKVI